jgi:formate hydrogenlyase subunit 4
MHAATAVHPLLACALAPLLPGVINRTKAFFAGRRGPPLFQPYYDLAKLLRKGAVYSHTTSWLFRAGPLVGLAAVLAATSLLPFADEPALLHFPGDLVLFAYLLAVARFFTVLAALDTGSSFEGMGASRELYFSALAEPALLLSLAALARSTGNLSLSAVFASIDARLWAESGLALALVAATLAVVFLAENSRIPVDDPNTHLELTMVHEVMVLDHGGPDFAFVLFGAALKLWVLGALIVGLVVPVRGVEPAVAWAASLAGMLALAVFVGIVESAMARLRLVRVPQLLVGAGVLSVLALIMLLLRS